MSVADTVNGAIPRDAVVDPKAVHVRSVMDQHLAPVDPNAVLPRTAVEERIVQETRASKQM